MFMLQQRYTSIRRLALWLVACAVTVPAAAMDMGTASMEAATTVIPAAMAKLSTAQDGSIQVPLAAGLWQTTGDVQFTRKEGFPLGIITLGGADPKVSAVLKGFSFGNGTIEFDTKAGSKDGEVNVAFRKTDASTETFYVRVSPDCAASQDCLQYTPVTHSRRMWDMYTQYQRPAPFVDDRWNHIKMVVSGRRMNVYVNRESTPSLSVGRLQGDALVGALSLAGSAAYANLVVKPDIVEGLPPEPEADPTASDQRYLRTWEMAPPVRLAEGVEPSMADVPSTSAAWVTTHAEDYGLINLARHSDAHPQDHTRPLIAWLRTNVQSDRTQTPHVCIGFLREVWVFVDGKLVYADKNLYHVADQRKDPDGRLSLENGSFDLPLHKGANHVVVAIRSNTADMRDQYGWGMQMRLQNLDGVTIVH
jgi:hypothetical protein